MSRSQHKKFGKIIRSLRAQKNISLRKFACAVSMSPTYLSKVERGEFPPPAESKVVAIAKALDKDPDEMLGLAGRVASDLLEIIRKRPQEMASFLRNINALPDNDLKKLMRKIDMRKPSP